MLRSKLHRQKVFNLIPFSYKIRVCRFRTRVRRLRFLSTPTRNASCTPSAAVLPFTVIQVAVIVLGVIQVAVIQGAVVVLGVIQVAVIQVDVIQVAVI